MNRTSLSSLGVILFACAAPLSAEAHQIGGYGFASGASHPLLGADHLLAMVAVGVIAVRLGGRALWALPSAFVAFMLAGGALAVSGAALPVVESVIALSVVTAGIVLAFGKDVPLRSAAAVVAFFALFHGHAHGAEMPLLVSPALYALGLLLSTALLHGAGVLVGRYAVKNGFSTGIFRFAGAGVSLAGILFLVG